MNGIANHVGRAALAFGPLGIWRSLPLSIGAGGNKGQGEAAMSRIELRHSEFLAIAAGIGEIRNAELRQHVANKVFRAVWLHAPSRLVGNGNQPNDGVEWFEACRSEYSK